MNDSTYRSGLPRVTAPVVDPETGKIAEPWLTFFTALWNRTGSGQGSNITVTNNAITAGLLSLDDDGTPPSAFEEWTRDFDASLTCDDSAMFALALAANEATPEADDSAMIAQWIVTDQDPTPYQFPPLGRVSGSSYPAWDGNVAATGPVGAASTIYLYPFFLDEDVTITALFLRVVTVGTTGAAGKAGIWMSKNGRPVGPPIIADNTGVAMTATGIAAFSITSTLLRRGWYWFGSKFATATTQPVCTNIVGTSLLMASRIGGTTTANAILNGATNQMSGKSFADAYANSLPDLTGASLIDVVGAASGIPVLGFTVG